MTIVLEDFALQHLLLAVGRHDKIVWVWSIAVVGEGQSMRALKHSRGTLVCGHVLKSDKARDQEIVRVVLNIGMDLFGYSMLWTGNTNTKFLEDSDPAQTLHIYLLITRSREGNYGGYLHQWRVTFEDVLQDVSSVTNCDPEHRDERGCQRQGNIVPMVWAGHA